MSLPLILISNDDGYQAKGLHELIRTLSDIAEIYVVVPDGGRSGMSCSIHMFTPVHCELICSEPNLTMYKCSGSPTDCVKLGIHKLLPRTPDLVIGGINHGENSASCVHYSGTMGVVMEGAMKNIPSIGFSLCSDKPNADFAPVLPYVQKITQTVLDKGLQPWTCLNVNFPDLPEFKGVRCCRQAQSIWMNEWEERTHPNGRSKYYWMIGDFIHLEPEADDTDLWALSHGYVSITPTQVDMTAYSQIKAMADWNLES